MLKMRCKSCSKAVAVDRSLAGQQIQCPHCGAVSKAPDPRRAGPEKTPVAQDLPVAQPTVAAAPEPAQPAEPAIVPASPTIRVSTRKPAVSRSTGRTPRRKKNAKPGLLLLAGSLLVLGVVGAVAYVVLGNKRGSPRTAPSRPGELAAVPAVASLDQLSLGPPESIPAQPSPPEATEEFVEEMAPDQPPAASVRSLPRSGDGPMADGKDRPRPVEPEAKPSDAKPVPVAAELPQAELSKPPPARPPDESLPPSSPTGLAEDDEEKLVGLYSNRTLFSVKEYPTLRRIFAERFARLNAAEIRKAWGTDDETTRDGPGQPGKADVRGTDGEAMRAWLDQHRAIKEELYLAIDPQVDDVLRALQIFKSLKDKFPEQIVAYANLAIAIAVTWDQPHAIYDFAPHQRRAKAVMPEGLADEIAAFEYFLKTESVMQGRAQWLPWEFLVHVVNHRTPLEERAWALQNYLPNRVMFGKCYQDVPYDDLMLETSSDQARMNGHPYTLANLRKLGGVCALQGDFASRVGQSLGVPAAYVGGTSTFGELHAWVMWVEIKNVTAKSIVFTLESHGRYRGDRYYVGTLQDPKSGERITDRQLELRLHTVGTDPVAKRHADLMLAAYPVLKDKLDFGISEQFSYFSRMVELCPGHERVWLSLAGMATHETVKQKHRKQMTAVLNQLFNTFANFPDFTWTVFDDLIQFEDRLKERIKLYERLTLLYQAAQRPDLACEARLRLTDLLVEDGRDLAAVDGLAATIYAFVEEGRYVPRMLDRIEQICQGRDGAAPHLLRFYHSFLPRIPQMRGARPSRYCIEMFERAIALFRQHGEEAAAQAYEAQLVQIRAGQGRR